jgi:NAD(P)-dependent dehydrogenase (short-subunit alcohol dehydrogenase family)
MLAIQPPNWPLALAFALLGGLLIGWLKLYLRGRAVWRYDTRAAWLRAFAYFSFTWSLAMASGTVPTILANPLVLPGQASSPLWIAFTVLVFAVVIVGYWIIWPIGTRPHGRTIVVPDTVLFGIAWGVSEGLLFGSVWLLAKRFWDALLGAGTAADFAIVFTTILGLSAFIGLWHALYWDVHVSPLHNIAEWNIRKVLLAHNPNLILTSIYVTAWENLAIFVLLQAVALLGSALAMPFPSARWPHPDDPTGPDLGPPTDVPADLTGQTAVVTGAAHGMGRLAAERLAAMGAHVVIVDIDAAGAHRAAEEIEAVAGRRPDVVAVDLADLDQVRAAAARILAAEPRIDLLLNNAGTFTEHFEVTAEGVERMLAVNHLGHFLLTQLLLPRLAESQARIVFVSSDAHFQAGPIDWADVNGAAYWKGKPANGSAGFAQYNRSKLFVAAAAMELAERTRGTGVTVNVLTPGALIPTAHFDALSGPPGLFIRVLRPVLRKPEKAMTTYLYVSTSPEVAGVTGWYFKDARPIDESQRAQDPAVRKAVWDWSAAQAGLVSRQ